jgi:hypothetical protein
MYELIVSKAADLWAGTDPQDMAGSEYLRGQVELIRELGIAPYDDEDGDIVKARIADDILARTN